MVDETNDQNLADKTLAGNEESRQSYELSEVQESKDKGDTINLNDVNESSSISNELEPNIQLILQKKDYILLLLYFMINPLLIILRGNSMIKSALGISRCSFVDFLLILGYFALNIFLTRVSFREVVRRNSLIESTERSLVFTPIDTLTLISFMLLIGIMNGFISSGMAAMFTLVLISFKLDPFVASSTALFLTCLTTGSSSILFYLHGRIYPSALIINGILIILVVCLTRITIYRMLFKNKRSSVLVLCIVLILIISIPSNIIKILPKLYRIQKNGGSVWEFRFDSFCN